MKHKTIEEVFGDYFAEGTSAFLPHVSINCVVLAYRHPGLQVLVHRIPGTASWGLPGGFVKWEESLDEAAYRNLSLSGIGNVFLRQIRTFGDPYRVTGIKGTEIGAGSQFKEIMEWIDRRFVTVVYYGLIRHQETPVLKGGLFTDYQWREVNDPGSMAMDHQGIIEETRKILSMELMHYPIAANLLPDTFTINELRGVFEAILNRRIDRGTFRRKILKLGIVEQVDRRKDPIGRPSHLYRFDQKAYELLLAGETRFGF